MSPDESSEILLNYQTPLAPELSKSRRLAARISMWLGGFTILGGTCAGFSIVEIIQMERRLTSMMAASGPPPFSPPPTLWSTAIIGAGMALLLFASGITYLLGGIYIRRGSRKWVNIILVLAICHDVLIGIGVIILMVRMDKEAVMFIGWFLYFLYWLAIGQLVLKLYETRKTCI